MIRRQKPKANPLPAGLTLLPEVSRLMNSCRGNDEDCRIIMRKDNASPEEIKATETIEDTKRMTIVVSTKGKKILTYYG